MRLNPVAFDSFLGRGGVGQNMEWRRSFACACVSPSSGAPDPKHALCSGKGRIWIDAVATVVGVASQTVTAEWMASGMYETGDMVLSIPQQSAMYNAGQFDRVLMKNSTDVFSMPMTRGAANERLLFAVKDIERVFWLHPTTRLIVEGGIPLVSDTGTLTWPGGIGEPPPGQVYSLTGNKYDEYFIYGGYLSDRAEHQGARLPKKVVARKWDLFGR